MQMNLCLSGLADCYARVAYPAALDEAAMLIRQVRPDAVTVSEACSRDVARLARRTGYRFRFSRVIYDGRPFRCIDPGGRGVFGDALLTRAAIVATDDHAFTTQTSIEHRRWLCVTTAARVDVCTAHLDTRGGAELAGNDAQCPELAAVLAHRPAARAVIFGGDVNRRSSCAPAGFWTRTDAAAHQSAGLQQVYGSGTLREPAATVLPFAHSDHDALVVRARLVS
jgi:endonuclease/exonuclease/phosphatase family metal-dependent hydrolase